MRLVYILYILFITLLPSVALADTCSVLEPGTTVKVSDRPAVYVLNARRELLYFPSGNEYKSWRDTDTYEGITTISQFCFDELPIPTLSPAGVSFRPGSYLLKRADNPQLYVVEPGNRVRKINVASATSLYGNSPVQTIPQSIWFNYTVSTAPEITDALPHSGMLVTNNDTYFFIDNENKLRTLSPETLTANHIRTDFFRPVSAETLQQFATGERITARHASLSDSTQSASTTLISSTRPLQAPVIGGPTTLRTGTSTAVVFPKLYFASTDKTSSLVRFQLQLDDSADFSSPVIDFTSRLLKNGKLSFSTRGKPPVGDVYTTGKYDAPLSDGTYYWRVKIIDSAGNESPYTTANNGNPAFYVDTSQLPTIDLHFVMVSPNRANLDEAQLISDSFAEISHYLVSDNGEQLVTLTNKNPVYYTAFNASSCGTIITEDNPLGTYALCKNTEIVDPSAITLLVSTKIPTSRSKLSKPIASIKLSHLIAPGARGRIIAHELGHVFNLGHICDEENSNIMVGVGNCTAEIPTTSLFSDKQVAVIKKRVAQYVSTFKKLQ